MRCSRLADQQGFMGLGSRPFLDRQPLVLLRAMIVPDLLG